MAEKDIDILERYTEPLSHRIEKEYAIGEEFYHGEVKKGLRNSDGTGVLVGVTKVGSVQGYLLQDGQGADPRAAVLSRHRAERYCGGAPQGRHLRF